MHRARPSLSTGLGLDFTYWWQDDDGTVHDVQQGEGEEQGDAALVTLLLRLSS